MFARIPSASLPRRGRLVLILALAGLPLAPGCTKSEDTEPFVPASEGAQQPPGGGDLLSEDDACPRLLDAAKAAQKRLGCDSLTFAECPAFIRPAGGSGCYEYSSDSVKECESAYKDEFSCSSLAPCLVSAQLNETLATCELPSTDDGEGGAGGAAGAAAGGAPTTGGAPDVPEAGAPNGGAPVSGGAPAAGAPG